jgi:MFS family permease
MAVRTVSLKQHLLGKIPFAVRFVTLALLVGGFLGGVTNFLLINGFWPWAMPDLAYRFLAAAAVAYVVGSLVTFFSSRWVVSEYLMSSVLIYGYALVAAVLIDAGQIDWSKIVAWLFVIIVTIAGTIGTIFVLAKRKTATAEVKTPLNNLTRYFVLGLGLLSFVVALLVYFIPKSAGFIWPWAVLPVWTPLDSRLIASMLLTIGGGAFLVFYRNDREVWQVFASMLWAYCIVAGAGIALHATVTPAMVLPDVIYLVVFAIILLVSFGLFMRERKPV